MSNRQPSDNNQLQLTKGEKISLHNKKLYSIERRDSINRETLRRVEINDPTLKRLTIGSTHMLRWADTFSEDNGVYVYAPELDAELSGFGQLIARNTHLEELWFNVAKKLSNKKTGLLSKNTSFYNGLKMNASIRVLDLLSCNLAWGTGNHVLKAFEGKELQKIYLDSHVLSSEETDVLAATLSSVKRIDINRTYRKSNNAPTVDEIIGGFIPSMNGFSQLGILCLKMNNIGMSSCQALATLLKNGNTKLWHLDLYDNEGIRDDGAEVLANALVNNTRLKFLNLDSCSVNQRGWSSFSQLLCNNASIQATYTSNHTLRSLGDHTRIPDALKLHLAYNRWGIETQQIALLKIMKTHPNIGVEVFFEWEMKILPFLVHAFDKAEELLASRTKSKIVKGIFRTMTQKKKLKSIYNFARAMPMMFVPVHSITSGKRKRE